MTDEATAHARGANAGPIRPRQTAWSEESWLPAEPWMKKGACRGIKNPDIFFPSVGPHPSQAIFAAALKVCDSCPIATRLQCAAYALTHNETEGVWGGMTPQQRKHIRNGEAPGPNPHCKEPGCFMPKHARDLCHTHYQIWDRARKRALLEGVSA